MLTNFLKLVLPSLGERNWGEKINENFTKVDSQLKLNKDTIESVDSRITNIIGSSGTSPVEVTDARQSEVKNKTFTILDDRLEEAEKDIDISMGLLQPERSGYNEDLSIWAIIQYKDLEGNLRVKSELIDFDDSNSRYTKRKVIIYEADGTIVRKEFTLDQVYDENGNWIKETVVVV